MNDRPNALSIHSTVTLASDIQKRPLPPQVSWRGHRVVSSLGCSDWWHERASDIRTIVWQSSIAGWSRNDTTQLGVILSLWGIPRGTKLLSLSAVNDNLFHHSIFGDQKYVLSM